MSAMDTNLYMEHPLVRDYLHDLDVALSGLSAREAGEIKESIREHLVMEFSFRQASDDALVGAVVRETLDKLGPVESIIGELARDDEDASGTRTQRRTIVAIAATIVSVILIPFAVGVSVILSTIALVVAVKFASPRARTVLIVINTLVLLVALVYLIIALTTVGLLAGTVQGSS